MGGGHSTESRGAQALKADPSADDEGVGAINQHNAKRASGREPLPPHPSPHRHTFSIL